MNSVVEMPWGQLTRYQPEQQRYLHACLGRESDPVIPFGGPVTALRADAGGLHEIAADAVRIAYVAGDGEEHVEVVLGRGDLLSLGIGPWIHRIASIETLGEVLAEMLRPSMRRASAMLGGELTLRVQRLADDPVLPRLAWAAFIAEGVPCLGRLKFKMSPALIDACEAHPMPRRGPGAMHHLPLVWDVRLSSILLARHEWQALARGDVVRVLLSPLPQAEVVGALVPHCDKSSMPGAALGLRRQVKVLIDAGGWISLRFGQTTLVGDTMEDYETLDGLTVPVNLTLPVAKMSLREIDGVEAGALVDTGVRLQDVEVALWTAGQRFASGRLVVIGDCLGVEIVRTERDLP
jgi:flagellar motor switch/type III secretory pathway protein FliN